MNLSVVEAMWDNLDHLSPREGGSRRALVAFVDDCPGHGRRCVINAEPAWNAKRTFVIGLDRSVSWYV